MEAAKLETALAVARSGEAQAVQAVALAQHKLDRTLVTAPYAASIVARLADDEFALLLRGTDSSAAAVGAGKRAHSLTDWLLTQGHDLTCSVGFTTAPRGRLLDADTLLARAVAHLYERRSAGPASERPPALMPAAVVPVTSARESA